MATKTIRVILQQPGEAERAVVVELEDDRLPALAVMQKFGLSTLELVSADAEPVLLGYRPHDGLSHKKFVDVSEIRVCRAVIAEESSVLVTIKTRLPCTTKYAAYVRSGGFKEAAVVVNEDHVATYQHAAHGSWCIGQQVQVFVHDGGADHPRSIQATVDYINAHTDFVLLKVHEVLQAPVLDAQLSVGQQYFVLGQSAQMQGDASSVSHGIIAATQPDTHAHVRGDIMAGQGDSGAGCFAVETGRLIGMVVGVDKQAHKAVLVPGAGIALALAQVSAIPKA